MQVVCISDTHGFQISVPDGDMLIHAGDGTHSGTEKQVRELGEWLHCLPHKHKIFVPGNHDFLFETEEDRARYLMPGVEVLINEGRVIEGLMLYGTPDQPQFRDWAFNRTRTQMAASYADIPEGLDILITHCPPRGTLDMTREGESVGSLELTARLIITQPRYHIFGHIHESSGVIGNSLNASICTREYQPTNKPLILEIDNA